MAKLKLEDSKLQLDEKTKEIAKEKTNEEETKMILQKNHHFTTKPMVSLKVLESQNHFNLGYK